VSPEPSARWGHIWRKLKRLGALLLHDTVWVLPATPYTIEQFQWLATEIEEMEGQAMVWEAAVHLDSQDSALAARCVAQAEEGYREILAALRVQGADRPALSRRFQHVQAQDYSRSPLAEQVREALAATVGGDGAAGDEEGGMV